MNAAGSFAGQTVEAARRLLTARLNSGGIDSAELDTRILIGAVLGLDLTGLIISARRILASEESASLEAFAARRRNPVKRGPGPSHTMDLARMFRSG